MTPYHWLAQPVYRPRLTSIQKKVSTTKLISEKPYNSKVIPTVVDQTY